MFEKFALAASTAFVAVALNHLAPLFSGAERLVPDGSLWSLAALVFVSSLLAQHRV